MCLITKEGESLSFRIEKTRPLELLTSIVGWSGTCDQSQARQKVVDIGNRRQNQVNSRRMCTLSGIWSSFFARVLCSGLAGLGLSDAWGVEEECKLFP